MQEACLQSEKEHSGRTEAIYAAGKRPPQTCHDICGKRCKTGDIKALQALFAEDVVFLSDGGGKAPAALNPVHGANAVARLIFGLAQKLGMTSAVGNPVVQINGAPGFMFETEDGRGQSFRI